MTILTPRPNNFSSFFFYGAALLLPRKKKNCHVPSSDSYCFCCDILLANHFWVSIECSEAAWRAHHQYECGHLDLLHSLGVGHLGKRLTNQPINYNHITKTT